MEILNSVTSVAADVARSLPPWVIGVLILAITAMVTVVLHGVLFRLIQRLARHRAGEFWVRLLNRVYRPSRIGLLIVTLSIALQVVPIYGRAETLIIWTLLLAFIVFVGWCTLIVVDTAADLYMQRFTTDSQDPLLARRHLTQVRLLQRTAVILIYVITLSALLMTIPAVRQFGVSLFASAGVAGLIVGLAARPFFSNLIAGFQIAVAQPIRIGDEVLMEGEFGTIEEIRTTYFVLKTWDWRRLIIPLSYVMEKPFQNWTLTSSSQIGTVFWLVDYMTPVEPIRQKFYEFVKQSKLWDGQVAVLQETDVMRDALQLRGLMSAATAGAAWDLRCEGREKLMTWIQASYPQSQPLMRRIDVGAGGARKDAAHQLAAGRPDGP